MEHAAYGAAVYGSVVATALVAAEFEEHTSARTMTLSLLATMLVLWLAHLWSETVGAPVGRARLQVVATAEWPLVEVALVPVALLALAWAGLWSRNAGALLAISAGIAQLAGWGLAGGLQSHERLGRAVLRGLVDAAFGLAIVGLEVAIHHL